MDAPARLPVVISPTRTPSLLFIPLGVALGANGLAVVPDSLVSQFDPFVPVALAALGVYLGLSIGAARVAARMLAVAGAAAGLTIGVVTLAIVAGGALWLGSAADWRTALVIARVRGGVSAGAAGDRIHRRSRRRFANSAICCRSSSAPSCWARARRRRLVNRPRSLSHSQW